MNNFDSIPGVKYFLSIKLFSIIISMILIVIRSRFIVFSFKKISFPLTKLLFVKKMCIAWKFEDLRNPNDFKVLRPVLGETSEKKLRYTSYNLTGEHKKFCQNRDSQARRNFGIPWFIEA